MSIVAIQRQIDAAYDRGDADEYHRLLTVLAIYRRAGR